jgi:hypothetical protein
MKQQVKINTVKSNPNNPRIIKDAKFQKLVQSLKDFPEMLEKRPIVVDENMIVLGGNMRLKALLEAGVKDVWIDVAEGWTEEQKKEFIIKDNVGFGEWDWDILANEWEPEDLSQWSLDLPIGWTKENELSEPIDKVESKYLAIVVVAYEDVEDLDKITTLYDLTNIDITQEVKGIVNSQRKMYVFKK